MRVSGESLGDLGTVEGAAADDSLDGRDDFPRRRVLEHIAAGAGTHGLAHVLIIVVHAEDEDLEAGVLLAQQPGQLEPVLVLETDVHQQQVRLAATDHFDCLRAVLGFADHIQLRHH
ncbi:hypothetical protein D3C78_1555950 [compost metagenome]